MDPLISKLKALTDLVYAREESFIEEFLTKRNHFQGRLYGIYFGASHIKVSYLLTHDQPMTNTIYWEEFNNWLEGK